MCSYHFRVRFRLAHDTSIGSPTSCKAGSQVVLWKREAGCCLDPHLFL